MDRQTRRVAATGVLQAMRRDIDSVLQRDPAARSRWEVVLLYPGVHAVWSHRVSHRLWRRGSHLPARALAQATRALTGIEIHPGARLGRGLFIDHGSGVVIGETAEVGDDVTIYHGVTLGGTSLDRGKRHPTVGDRVTIGAGAKVLGPITVGHDTRIGANSVLVRDVDPDTVVVGVPGQVVVRDSVRVHRAVPDLDNASVPDPLGTMVPALMQRVARLEAHLTGQAVPEGLYRSSGGIWQATDFSI